MSEQINNHYKNVVPPNNIKLLIITEAPPSKSENYFYNVSMNDSTHGTGRSFFMGIMQGIGLLRKGTRYYSERRLLDSFLENGYFLIDTCAIPLEPPNGKMSDSAKREVIEKYIDSLADLIENKLKPKNILFVLKSNEIVLENLKKRPYFMNRLVLDICLPYPGNGWLYPRKDKQPSFIELFPKQYRLNSIY
jgi:hypothetical protein